MKIGIDLTFIRPDHKNGGTESSLKNLMKGLLAERKIHDYLFLIHEDLRTIESCFPRQNSTFIR